MFTIWDYLGISLVSAIALYFWYSVGRAVGSGRTHRKKDETERRQDGKMKG